MAPENQVFDEIDVPQMGFDELDSENIQSLCPNLYEQLREQFIKEGRALEKQRNENLKRACGGSPKLFMQAITDEKTATELLQFACEQTEGENTRLRAANEKLAERSALLTDEQLKEHFAKTKELQDEFGDVKSYIAYIKADKAGQIR